jgi:hypothetical protein
MIADALAAHGYTMEIPPQECARGTTATVMTQGLATVLLLETPDQAKVEIECSGAASDVTAQLLESLPLPLQKDSGAVRS